METQNHERRKHTRYKAHENVLAFNEDTLAEVIDISSGGISCRCLTSIDNPIAAVTHIDVLNCDQGTSVQGLTGKMIRSSEKAISESLSSTRIFYFSLQFTDMNDNQFVQLFQFIVDNCETKPTSSTH